MGRAYFSVVLGGTFLALLVGLMLWVHSDPSTSAIDQDIAGVQREIADATTERDKYSGGLITVLIDVRSNILKSTESMLEAKRLSWLRRVDMVFTVDGRAVEPQPQQSLDAIEKDIQETDQRIAKAEAEAERYSGGLVQGLALVNVATERVTRAQLLLAYYSAKYGLAAPLPKTEKQPESPPPNTVKDKDAL
jgi:hypothetical protein